MFTSRQVPRQAALSDWAPSSVGVLVCAMRQGSPERTRGGASNCVARVSSHGHLFCPGESWPQHVPQTGTVRQDTSQASLALRSGTDLHIDRARLRRTASDSAARRARRLLPSRELRRDCVVVASASVFAGPAMSTNSEPRGTATKGSDTSNSLPPFAVAMRWFPNLPHRDVSSDTISDAAVACRRADPATHTPSRSRSRPPPPPL